MPRARRSPAKSRENLDKHCGSGPHQHPLPNGHGGGPPPPGPAVNGVGYPPNSQPGAGLPELNATDLSDTLDSIVAQIPFDDGHGVIPGGPAYPPTSYPGPRGPPMVGHGPPHYMMQNKPGPHMHHPGPPMPGAPGTGKIYPPNQPMVFNPSNPNAPPIYPCGICHKEVHDNDQAILCESGCNFWFHRICTGLSEPAYQMLRNEVYAEWVCDNCLSVKSIPLVKMKP